MAVLFRKLGRVLKIDIIEVELFSKRKSSGEIVAEQSRVEQAGSALRSSSIYWKCSHQSFLYTGFLLIFERVSDHYRNERILRDIVLASVKRRLCQ